MTGDSRNPRRDFRSRFSHASRTATSMTNSDRVVSAQELTETIIALSTAYAAMARELERHDVFKMEDLSEVLIATANSTDGLTRLILQTLGDSLIEGRDDPPQFTVLMSGESVH